jgi:pilus assembly protein CpaF
MISDMNENYKNLEGMVSEVIGSLDDVSDSIVMKTIEKCILSQHPYITVKDKVNASKELFNKFRRLGQIQQFLDDDSISEIMINGTERLFIEKDGRLLLTDILFQRNELYQLIQKMVSMVDRKVNERNPICDLRLEDGSRVNIVYDSVGLKGPYVTIRKFPKVKLSSLDIISNHTISIEAMLFLEGEVRGRKNIFVSGGTSSGKTTLLNILSNAISENERVITIEDSAELKITSVQNLVSLEARPKGDEYTNPVSIRELIRSSLRMRPDRIIVGEVRGEETIDMLQSMNTGHDGSLSTGHANSIYDMLIRLETMVLAEMEIPLQAIRQQIASAIDLMVHIEKVEHVGRRIMEIARIKYNENDHIAIEPLYYYDRQSDKLVVYKEGGSIEPD